MVEQHTSIAAAIIGVMQDVRGVGKNATVGAGNNKYKGVNDKEVKEVLRAAMAKHGLAIIPKSVEATTQVERWEENTQWGNKQKQSVFVEARTVYTLLHTSGETLDIEGYGHGVDTQDKAAGKATTYALKYALLYTFLVPTGDIDDSDMVHSDAHEAPPKQPRSQQAAQPARQQRPTPAQAAQDFQAPQQRQPTADDITAAVEHIDAAESLEALKLNWADIPKHVKAHQSVMQAKEARKQALSQPQPDLATALDDNIPF